MKIRVQRTWYGWKAWDPQDKVAAWDSPRCIRSRKRENAIEKARIKFGPKDPKWEEVDV